MFKISVPNFTSDLLFFTMRFWVEYYLFGPSKMSFIFLLNFQENPFRKVILLSFNSIIIRDIGYNYFTTKCNKLLNNSPKVNLQIKSVILLQFNLFKSRNSITLLIHKLLDGLDMIYPKKTVLIWHFLFLQGFFSNTHHSTIYLPLLVTNPYL
jgi:hypothetical protein